MDMMNMELQYQQRDSKNKNSKLLERSWSDIIEDDNRIIRKMNEGFGKTLLSSIFQYMVICSSCEKEVQLDEAKHDFINIVNLTNELH